jgi:hypothetical protein
MNSQRSEARRQRSEMNSQLRTLNSEPSIELRIQELVLHGFAPGDRYVIGDAVERELGRLLDERGIPDSLRMTGATDALHGATFNTPHNAKPPAIGRKIGQAVYEGFGQ